VPADLKGELMGQATEREEFTEADLVRFRDRLGSNLKSLETLLQTPGFGDGPMSFGAEIELYIVDGQGRPLPINKELQQALGDKQLTLELNRFNLEYNFTPVLVRDSCFGKTEKEALSALSRINARAERRQSPAIERAALADGHGLAVESAGLRPGGRGAFAYRNADVASGPQYQGHDGKRCINDRTGAIAAAINA
jgi:hypothetical protein